METITNAPINLTAGAIRELERIRREDGIDPTHYLRVGVKGGGCSGLSYVLGFDAKVEDDEVYEVAGIPVVMKKSHGLYLLGMEIDFKNGLDARGFTFTNPNATSSCGCGSSFAV